MILNRKWFSMPLQDRLHPWWLTWDGVRDDKLRVLMVMALSVVNANPHEVPRRKATCCPDSAQVDTCQSEVK